MSRDLNRFGLRYFQDEGHYTQADWKTWRNNFASLGVGWLALTSSERRAIPESFLRAVINDGIRPLIQIPAKVGSISLREIAPILKSYADWGVRHVVVYDRPNMQSSWNPSDWSRSALIERFLDVMLPLLHIQYEVGLQPMMPPLEPGGDYWDTAFLEAVLSALQRRGQTSLLNQLGLAAYAWSFGRHLDWGTGGSQAWPNAKPYHCMPGCENHIGFRIFEWYQEIATSTIGLQVPIYIVTGGHSPGGQDTGQDPLEIQTEIFNQMQSMKVPGYVQCINFEAFLGAAGTATRWFLADGNTDVMADKFLQARRKHLQEASAQLPKTLDHYALVAQSGTHHAIKDWEKLASFAIAVQPAIGFSADEARYAKKVTILASEDEIPADVDQQLEDSGCEVSRIDMHSDEKLLDAITAFALKNKKAGGEHE